MSAIINFGPNQPTQVTLSATAETRDALPNAVDIGRMCRLDLELVIVSLDVVAPVTIGICTGMRNDAEDGWLSNTATPSLNFFPMTTGTQHRSFTGLLRYVRWVVRPVPTGPQVGTNVFFYIRGMARGALGGRP